MNCSKCRYKRIQKLVGEVNETEKSIDDMNAIIMSIGEDDLYSQVAIAHAELAMLKIKIHRIIYS